MRIINRKSLILGLMLFFAFILWTVFVCFVDVQAIGPEGTEVGFAELNRLVHRLTGVNLTLYTVTDWLGLVPIGVALGFAILGLTQMIKRRGLLKVDRGILLLGAFYILVITAYLFFEIVVINYRPILIDGRLEASYPSSTTMLVLCVLPTSIRELRKRIKNKVLKRCLTVLILTLAAFMAVGRLLSGVHWITDIIGGVLFSAGLVTLYYSLGI
jgi:undecaprenyl-diphosphatase